MITVTIFINDRPIFTRTAVNISQKIGLDKRKRTPYQVDDGSIIYHHSKKGAVKLAKLMLDTIKEPI